MELFVPKFKPLGHLAHIHALLNSSTANSPDRALVYLLTIAPLDQPASSLTDVSEIPLRRDLIAQPRLQAWADGISIL